MIDKLTPEQEKLMITVRDEWINLCLGGDTSIDENKAREWVNWLYELSDLKPPKNIVFARGPMEAQIIGNTFPEMTDKE